MSDVLVFGGSPGSVGAYIAARLPGCVRLSRSTVPGVDVLSSESVQEAIERERPHTIISAAMVYPDPVEKELGSITGWGSIHLLLDTKIQGAYHIVDAAVSLSVKRVILLAGTAISKDPRLCHFTIVNGALWSLACFANEHTSLDVYYLEMGLISPGRTCNHYLKSLNEHDRGSAIASAITPDDVVAKIRDIVNGTCPRGRIVLNKDNV